MDGSQYDPDEYVAMEDAIEDGDNVIYYASMHRIEVSQVDNDLVEHTETSHGDHMRYGLRVFHIPHNVSMQDSAFELEWCRALSNGADNIDLESIDNVREILRRGPSIEAVSERSGISYEHIAEDSVRPAPVDTAVATGSGEPDTMSIASDDSIPSLEEIPESDHIVPDFTDEETYALALTGRLRTLCRELLWTRYELLHSLERYQPSAEDRERIRNQLDNQN
ncbi:hypothetical protein C8Q72DRAFT_622708 [Fomitopsis betulina]|nr:hypothetical protein C8Q72DRAFT_622708 [Fomitopsis betulina]